MSPPFRVRDVFAIRFGCWLPPEQNYFSCSLYGNEFTSGEKWPYGSMDDCFYCNKGHNS